MLKNEIKLLCKEIQDHQYSLDYEIPLSAALTLGKVYHYLKVGSEEDKALLNETLGHVKRKLNTNVIQTIWNDINSKVEKNYRKTDGYLVLINEQKMQMITDEFYFKKLDRESIIQFGQNAIWHRFSMVALIRKHLDKKGSSDPFAGPEFKYTFLNDDSSRETANPLSSFLKKCNSIPVDDIFQLGKGNPEIAKLILFDLVGTIFYFQVSSRFAQHYPNLRSDIARHWQDYINVNALDTHMEEFIRAELNILKERCPEFKNINIKSRQARYSNASQPEPEAQNQPNHDQEAFYKLLWGATFVGGFCIGKTAGKVLAAKVIATAAVANPVAVVGLGCFAAGYAAFKWGPQAYERANEWMNGEEPRSRSAPAH